MEYLNGVDRLVVVVPYCVIAGVVVVFVVGVVVVVIRIIPELADFLHCRHRYCYGRRGKYGKPFTLNTTVGTTNKQGKC